VAALMSILRLTNVQVLDCGYANITTKHKLLFHYIHQPLLTTAVSPSSKDLGFVTGTMTPVMK